jgi:two-component system, NtrC family, nitrogen regulation sensor histidine kinase NtrY
MIALPITARNQERGRVARAQPGRRARRLDIRDSRVSLRGRIFAYLTALHLVFAVLAAYLLRENRYWLFAVEVLFVVSLVTGLGLARSALRSLGLAADAARLIRERELTSRLLDVGDPDVDAIVAVYNRLVDSLRDERTRLQEQHHFLAQIVRVSPSGIVILDFDGRVSDLNPAAERLLDLDRAATIGRDLEALAHADGASPLVSRLSTLPAGRAAVVGLSGARRLRCHRGTFIDRGFPRTFFLIEELTEEIRQSERTAYERLIRVMSHEVNNTVGSSNSLLHSTLTYASELPPAHRSDFKEALGIVIGRTEQLNRFMRGFADVYRLPAPLREACVVMSLLEPIVRLQAARPEAVGVTWRWDVPDPTLRAAVDRGQFEQALQNIIKNAVEAAGPGGTVTVRLHAGPRGPSLIVEDSGPGLGAEVQANLFTPFFSTKPHGQGIGLTLVQEILVAHGFDFSLEGPAGGPTQFTIRLH